METHVLQAQFSPIIIIIMVGWGWVSWLLCNIWSGLPAPGDIWEKLKLWWDENRQEILKFSEKYWLSAVLPNTNPTLTNLRLKTGYSSEKPVCMELTPSAFRNLISNAKTFVKQGNRSRSWLVSTLLHFRQLSCWILLYLKSFLSFP
jgi:hypothetical protein